VPEVPADTPTPEQEFDRSWARELLQNALEAFHKECERQGKPHYYAVFERHVLNPEEHGEPTYCHTANALGMSESDVANHLHRAKELFAATLRRLIRQTVACAREVEEELADFRQWFG